MLEIPVTFAIAAAVCPSPYRRATCRVTSGEMRFVDGAGRGAVMSVPAATRTDSITFRDRPYWSAIAVMVLPAAKR